MKTKILGLLAFVLCFSFMGCTETEMDNNKDAQSLENLEAQPSPTQVEEHYALIINAKAADGVSHALESYYQDIRKWLFDNTGFQPAGYTIYGKNTRECDSIAMEYAKLSPARFITKEQMLSCVEKFKCSMLAIYFFRFSDVDPTGQNRKLAYIEYDNQCPVHEGKVVDLPWFGRKFW